MLKYGDSGDVSGDKDAVVGYLAAAFGTFAPAWVVSDVCWMTRRRRSLLLRRARRSRRRLAPEPESRADLTPNPQSLVPD